MQKNLFLFLFLIALGSVNAQDSTSKETVEYIETLYKNSFKYNTIQVTSVQCEGNVLIKTFSDNDTAKTNLINIKKLQLERHYDGTKWHITYIDLAGKVKNDYILGHIQSESDAIKLKEVLEHLLKLVKSEQRSTNNKGK